MPTKGIIAGSLIILAFSLSNTNRKPIIKDELQKERKKAEDKFLEKAKELELKIKEEEFLKRANEMESDNDGIKLPDGNYKFKFNEHWSDQEYYVTVSGDVITYEEKGYTYKFDYKENKYMDTNAYKTTFYRNKENPESKIYTLLDSSMITVPNPTYEKSGIIKKSGTIMMKETYGTAEFLSELEQVAEEEQEAVEEQEAAEEQEAERLTIIVNLDQKQGVPEPEIAIATEEVPAFAVPAIAAIAEPEMPEIATEEEPEIASALPEPAPIPEIAIAPALPAPEIVPEIAPAMAIAEEPALPEPIPAMAIAEEPELPEPIPAMAIAEEAELEEGCSNKIVYVNNSLLYLL